MKPKPVSPFAHGIIDYVFALTLFTVPSIIKLNKKVRRMHTLNALLILSYSVFTKYPPGIKQIIPLHLHKKMDCASLALIAFESGYKNVRKDKRAMIFNVCMVTAGILTVLLTDWNKTG